MNNLRGRLGESVGGPRGHPLLNIPAISATSFATLRKHLPQLFLLASQRHFPDSAALRCLRALLRLSFNIGASLSRTLIGSRSLAVWLLFDLRWRVLKKRRLIAFAIRSTSLRKIISPWYFVLSVFFISPPNCACNNI